MLTTWQGCNLLPASFERQHAALMLARSQFGTGFFCFCGLGCSSTTEISLQWAKARGGAFALCRYGIMVGMVPSWLPIVVAGA